MKNIDPNKKIILDADVGIHFLRGSQIGILHKIFPNKLYMPDVVFEETYRVVVLYTPHERIRAVANCPVKKPWPFTIYDFSFLRLRIF